MEMSAIAGRQDETAILKSVLASDEAEFIAVYGRRRIGKTYLIKTFFHDMIRFEITGMFDASLHEQLTNFAHALGKASGTGIIPQTPASWQEAFFQLESWLESHAMKETTGKKVVFLDELPWLNTPRSKFLPALENFWNSYGSAKKDLVLVVCGSAASWMLQNIVRSRGGLHNRLTRQIRLLPFTLSETEQFLKLKKIKLTRFQIIGLYMAFGGVPYYLKQAEPGLSTAQIIDKNCFTKDGSLRNEYEQLYASLFEESHYHQKIVELLAKKRKGFTRNELLNRAGISSGGTATKILNELEESGFIDLYIPFGKQANDALYRLSDEFTRFHFDWIKPLGKKTPGDGYWLSLQNKPKYNTWAGFTFETLCLKHVQKIKYALGIGKVETAESAWRFLPEKDSANTGAQIDLLIDRKDDTINLCEIKYSAGHFLIDSKYAAELRNKTEVFKSVTGTRKNVFVTLITTFGLFRNEYVTELVHSEVTMESLF
jgi:AAA+ ATPase superfamily predicted ATPase